MATRRSGGGEEAILTRSHEIFDFNANTAGTWIDENQSVGNIASEQQQQQQQKMRPTAKRYLTFHHRLPLRQWSPNIRDDNVDSEVVMTY